MREAGSSEIGKTGWAYHAAATPARIHSEGLYRSLVVICVHLYQRMEQLEESIEYRLL